MSLSNPNAGVPRQISLPDNDVPLVTDAGDADPLDTKANEDVRNMLKEEEEERRKRLFMIVGGVVFGLAALTAIIVGIALSALKEPGANARSVDPYGVGAQCSAPICHLHANLTNPNGTVSECDDICEVFKTIRFRSWNRISKYFNYSQ